MRVAILGPAAPQEFRKFLQEPTKTIPAGMGGTPVNALVLALLNLGHQVHLITGSTEIKEVWRANGERLAVSVVPFRARARARALDFFRTERRALKEEIDAISVDVVHAHWTYEFGWAGVLSNRPTLVTAHDAPVTILKYMPNAYRLVRLAMAYRVRFGAKCVSAVSPYLARRWRQQMLFCRDVAVVSNIVAPSEIARVHGKKLVISDVSSAGNLKNVKRLIEGFATVHAKFPHSELRLAGYGLGSRDELAAWANDHSLSKGVTFLGHQTRQEIDQLLSVSSVFCHPSLEESQGVSLVEAMSAGVPVIGGQKSGSVPWTLGYGTAGLLVNVHKSSEIAGGILRLLSEPALAERMVEEGLELVAARHLPVGVAKQYVELYVACIAEWNKARAAPGDMELGVVQVVWRRLKKLVTARYFHRL